MSGWRAWLPVVALLMLASGGGFGGVAQARTLLWVTVDVTPASRTAQVERVAAERGWQVQHLDHPLQDPPAGQAAQRQAMAEGLARADLVWIDAPHPTVVTRLQRQFGELFEAHARQRPGSLVWIVPADASAGTPAADDVAARMAAYLRAGGAANLRHALRLGETWLTSGRSGAAVAAMDWPAPQTWPLRALYHPQAPGFLADVQDWQRWRAGRANRPTVAVLVHRHHFIDGETAWLDRWLQLFEAQGLDAYAVFGQQLDANGLRELLGAAPPRVLVLHQISSQSAALQALFQAWGTPVLATQPYRHGDTATWERDPTGLKLADAPFYLVQPEAAGAIDPVVVTAHADGGRRTELIERQAQAVADKARRLVALRDTPAAHRQLVAMVYNYPPGGSHFGASFLNVPRSLEVVSASLAEAGYRVPPTREAEWIERLRPLLRAYYPDVDLIALLRNDQAAALPLRDYLAWWRTLPEPVRARIAARWGEPASSRYVVHWQGEAVFVIPRLRAGNLSVLPQPPREETLRQGQNPFMHRSREPVSHHYLAVYLWARQAHALIHFGTHGTQEWANGKARGLDVFDDALLPLGDVPVVYPYIVDNLGEALTAKRRGRALLVSHRTPVLATTGLSPTMAHLHELMHDWAMADHGPTKQQIGERLVALIVESRLHHDLKWTVDQVRGRLEEFLEVLHPWLDQLAHGSQPRGLAVFGRAPDEASRRLMVLQALRTPLLDALGEDVDETFLIDHRQVAASRPMRWLEVALRDAHAASKLDLRPPAPDSSVPNRAAVHAIDPQALRALAEQAQALDRLYAAENELSGLLAALDGRFVPAAYGGDPLRNPDSLPTGRNLIGLDPSRLPTRQAYTVAQLLFEQWLTQWQKAHPERPPQRLALSLWAGETLRHQGIMEAQALVALGVRPVWDAAGRPTRVELVPAKELGRPRVDVLLSVTGSYRDQFPALMALIDAAVALVSEAEPAGPVARHSQAVTDELRRQGVPPAQAQLLGRARVFGNAMGDYGTGLSEAVQDDRLRRRDDRLGALFLRRMGHPYLGGEPLPGIDETLAERTLGAQLKRADAAVLSRSSHLYGMVSSDDPFQYLGGLAAAARRAGRSEPLPLFVHQLHNADEPHAQTAAQSVALEMQSRYLHPGWVAAQKEEGYAGTLQVLKAAQFTWGWQSVVDDVVRADHWQGLHEVYVKDRLGLGVPAWLRSHPQAYAQVIERLIQAQRHGHWTPDPATRRELAALYRDLTREAPLAQELAGVRTWVDAHMHGALRASPVRGGIRQAPAVEARPGAEALPSRPEPSLLRAQAWVRVHGERLQRVPTAHAQTLAAWLALLLMLGLVAGGAVQQWQRGVQGSSGTGRARRW
ncbi:cobaltochelatase subunit CobN [Caldimonas sp.]|uniref:cobaltochelatase subunit CobN n=1 Tax=Caldimonas sp. TaxID=2838790 RepID=UPI00391B55E8